MVTGKRGALWIGAFGPQTALAVDGPRDFGRSWEYKILADAGKCSWHTVKSNYRTATDRPAVTVFLPVELKASTPSVTVDYAADSITVKLPANGQVRFVRGAEGWKVAP